MEGNGSYGTSWADQWDYGADTAPETKKSATTSTSAKYKQKVGDGLVKTKAAASTGFKKVKEGTSFGVQWVKDKYHKTSQKH